MPFINGFAGGESREAVVHTSPTHAGHVTSDDKPHTAGAPSSAIIKRGRCMYHAAAELADLGVGGDGDGALAAAARAFQRRALTEAPALMKHTAEAVQLETMRCLRVLSVLLIGIPRSNIGMILIASKL